MNESEQNSGLSQLKKMAPMALAAFGGLFLLLKKRSSGPPKVETHYHSPLEHAHEHVHVTHNRTDEERGVGGWEHLTASHSHLHNHASLEHSHRPHRNFDKEHATEAHIHNHDDPVG